MEVVFHKRKLDNTRYVYGFQVIDGTFSDPKYALSIACNQEMGKSNKLQDLDQFAHNTIILKLKDEIIKRRNENRKHMIVTDITYFPMIWCYIDDRDQTEVMKDATDQFSKDVINVWSSQAFINFASVIVVNLNIPQTGLKIVPTDDLFKE